MNTKELIFKKLRSLTTKEFNKDSKIFEIGIDSLDLVELVTDAEEELGITISDEELMNFETVGDVVKTIEDKQKK